MRPKASLTRTEIHGAAPILAALGDETRLRLLAQLSSEGPSSTSHLSAKGQVSRQAIAKHLDVLAEVGILISERNGRERVWAVDTKRITHVRKLLKQLSLAWDETSARMITTDPA
jgi:DNA-binding transcriptional ArsR family regulator